MPKSVRTSISRCLVIALLFSGSEIYAGDNLMILKNEVRAKYAAVLSCALDGKTTILSVKPSPIELAELQVKDVDFRLPRYRNQQQTKAMDWADAVLNYDNFKVLVQISEPNPELPLAWGESQFVRYRAIYGLSDARISQANTKEELAHLVTGVVLKSLLVTNLANNRFTEFRLPKLQGFVSGSLDKGSPSIVFECFSSDGKRRLANLAFMPLEGTRLTDDDVYSFMPAVEMSLKNSVESDPK